MNERRVTFFTREGCCLCHDALAEVERVRSERPFDLAIIDLDREASEEKRRAYDHEVPVVEIDGKKVMKFHVDPARLARLLDA